MPKKKEDVTISILDAMKAHFGSAVKAYWVYDGDLCPGCMTQSIDLFAYEGEQALSINGFMHREKGVLIGYLLCGKCATEIMAKSKFGPTPLHADIERNLKNAYQQYINSLDA